jgi:phosphoserine phosphatase
LEVLKSMQTTAPTRRVRLVAFDLDGTITRGQTVCEAIACRLGRSDRMRELERSRDVHELTAARHEMAGWYLRETRGNLCAALSTLEMAPGVLEAFELLRSYRVKTAIISITWDFAVEWFRARLRADYGVGTTLTPDGEVGHFWPEDKGVWLAHLTQRLGLEQAEVAAIGDSAVGDRWMLEAAGHRYFVGESPPGDLAGVIHRPGGDMLEIARLLVDPYAVRRSLAEDAVDLAAFEDRVHEPTVAFEDVVRDLKQRGKL